VLLAPDRNTYVVKDMPTTRGGNALDVLRNVPAVDVDIDNVVSLRGSSGVTIQINGRPSPMKPAQLGNYLAQLPADMIDKVEIIPNPSARDDPTGTAGIINITLKQKADAGTSGGLTLSGGTTGQVNAGGNFGYERGPLTFYGSYGFLRDRRPRTESIFRQNNYLDPITFLDESGTRLQRPFAHTLTSSVTYALQDEDELSLDIMYSTRDQDDSYGITYRDLNSAGILTGLSERLTTGRGNESSFETALGYKRNFARKGHRLSAEASVVRDAEGGPSDVTARALTLSGAPLGPSALETSTAWEHPRENNVKVRLRATARGAAASRDRLQGIAPAIPYVARHARLRQFDKRVRRRHESYQRLHVRRDRQRRVRDAQREAGQASVAGRSSRRARGEHVPPHDAWCDVRQELQQRVSEWARRVQRRRFASSEAELFHPHQPSGRAGSPRSNGTLRGSAQPLSRESELEPEYIRALELGLQRTGERLTVQLTPFWRHTIDAVRSIRTIDAAGVATRTYANIATADAYGGDATVALSGGRLRGFAGASAFHQVSNAANVTPGLSINAWGWRARANATMRFSKTMDVQGLVSYQPAMTVEQGRTFSRTQVNFAARKKLMDDQLNVTLRIIDPFNTSRENSTTTDPRFYQISKRARQIRGLLLGFSWTFGKPLRDHEEDLLSGAGVP
jgi:hypothetical protein